MKNDIKNYSLYEIIIRLGVKISHSAKNCVIAKLTLLSNFKDHNPESLDNANIFKRASDIQDHSSSLSIKIKLMLFTTKDRVENATVDQRKDVNDNVASPLMVYANLAALYTRASTYQYEGCHGVDRCKKYFKNIVSNNSFCVKFIIDSKILLKI